MISTHAFDIHSFCVRDVARVILGTFVMVLIRITKKNFNTVFNNRVVSNDPSLHPPYILHKTHTSKFARKKIVVCLLALINAKHILPPVTLNAPQPLLLLPTLPVANPLPFPVSRSNRTYWFEPY